MTSPTIETDLSKILDQINQNLAEFRQEANQNLAEFRQEANQNLAEFRKETNQKLEGIQKNIIDLKVGQVRLEGDIKALQENVRDLNGSQKAQIWALIGILGTAVVGTVIRFMIAAPAGNP